MTEAPTLVVDDLGKVFFDATRGEVTALAGVSWSAFPGRIFGLLGPNGAGKTTTLRIIATLIRPTSGRATLLGRDVVAHAASVRAQLGYLTGASGLYERSTVRELLAFFAALHGLPRAAATHRIHELVDLLAMGAFLDQGCGRLSDGQKQKVRLARVLVHDPPVLILDEPTANLDIIVGRDVLKFVAAERDRGKTIVLSTHVMSEVERLCDDLAVIHRGRLHFCGTTAELAAGGGVEDAFFKLIEAVDADVSEGLPTRGGPAP